MKPLHPLAICPVKQQPQYLPVGTHLKTSIKQRPASFLSLLMGVLSIGLTLALPLGLSIVTTTAKADEGMWLPLYLKQFNEARMKQLGLQLNAEEVFNNNGASLKDAIVWFGGGCTGEVISKQGLILTNHHCGFSEIANHSTLENNYLRDGFWAQSFDKELPNKNLSVSFVRRMEDVTQVLLDGLDPFNLSNADRATLKKRIADLQVKYGSGGKGLEVLIRPMFYGRQYYLFVLQTFKDVRLVGAPPSGIGKFGGDTDNWMWPRHTGDFSLFRIYAGPDNQPADYSAQNKPYVPERALTISLGGIKPGDFTMVYGFPGRTQQYIGSRQLKLITEGLNLPKIALRTSRLDIINKAMASGPGLQLMYADQQANIANAWKKWQGECKGVKRLNTYDNKLKLEQDFEQWLANPSTKSGSKLSPQEAAELKSRYKSVLQDMNRWADSLATVALATDYFREAVMGNGLLAFAPTWIDATNVVKTKDEAKVKSRMTSLRNQINEFYREHDPAIEVQLLAVCLKAYRDDLSAQYHPELLVELLKKGKNDPATVARELFKNSLLADSTKAFKAMKMLEKGDTSKLVKDPAIVLYKAFQKQYASLLPRTQRYMTSLEVATGLFTEGRMRMQPDRIMYPDANSTLRVAYGQVDGYSPLDGVYYKHYTTLDGVMEKDNEAIEEFRVPAKVRQLYQARDFGRYAVNGTVPVAFIASNHTTGGNSGSPVLDARGRLIGTNFDRCWEGTMSDLQYDKDQCRNIVLDVRYTFWVIEKVGNCKRLVDECVVE